MNKSLFVLIVETINGKDCNTLWVNKCGTACHDDTLAGFVNARKGCGCHFQVIFTGFCLPDVPQNKFPNGSELVPSPDGVRFVFS